MRPRILLAGFFHETNTFADDTTGIESFTCLHDGELLATRGDASPLGAVVELASQLGWQLVPTVDYRATPGGMVADDVIQNFWSAFAERAARPLAERKIDGIYLVLHGAAVSQSCDDVEGEILQRIRALPGAGHLPVFGVLDLHANLTARMVRHATGFVSYRENPHTDAAEAAICAARLLDRALGEQRERGSLPRFYARQLPLVWSPPGTGTADTPMRLLEAAARRLELEGHRAVNIIAGFAHADTPDTGVSVSIVTDLPEAQTEAALDELGRIAIAHREAGCPREWKLDDALDRILAGVPLRPALLVEPADNIGGGAPGDCTTLLRALVARRHPSAGVIINDPAAVARLANIPPGGKTCLSLGGKGSRLDPGPLELDVRLIRRTDGRFELEDKQSHLASMCGSQIDMGPCAVVRHEGVTILVTSRKTPPFDLGQWHSQGIDPTGFGVINVKAAVAHRRAYDRIAGDSYTVETPGPCASNLALLPFRKIRRPVFPLDAADSSPVSLHHHVTQD